MSVMTSTLISTLRLTRKLKTRSVFYLSKKRGFCASSVLPNKQQEQEEMDKLKGNPYFDKYAAKLQQKADESPEDFEAKVNELEEVKRKAHEEKVQSLKEERDRQRERATQRKAKGLDGVVKLELLQEKSVEEIAEIWTKYHSDKNCVYAVIQKEEYDQIHGRSQEFPTFLYALPRGEGYEFMVQQFDGHDCHFTPLVMFQRYIENAPPCFSVTHYTELSESKGIVLMNSEVNTDIISIHEAQLLALQLKMYYGVNAGLKINLLRMFKNSPDTFKHMDLVKEFEKYKQDFKDVKDGTWV